jgi:hypothetical protein
VVSAERAASEPAIPVIAPVPMASVRTLLDVAARQWPVLEQDGVGVAWHVDKGGLGVVATVSGHTWEGGLLGRVTLDGEWEAGGFIRWTPRAR